MIIDELKTIIDAVDSAVGALNYTAYTPITEPTDKPGLIPIDFEKDFQKIAINGQVYHTTLRVTFMLYAKSSETEANFNTLFDSVLTAVVASTGYEYIKVLNIRFGIGQISEDEVMYVDFTVEFLKKENW